MKKKYKSKLNKFALGGALIGSALFIFCLSAAIASIETKNNPALFAKRAGLFLINSAYAYDQLTTHPALTDEAVDFYNLNFPNNQLTKEDKDMLIKGAIEEDTPPRWLNHFYDPVHNAGWIGYTTSKKWAINSVTQQSFTDSAFDYGGFANLFSDNLSPTDYSYERALHDYAIGNRKRAMLSMGHVMHLLEDANVPEHTRGDTHLPWHGTESPYEKTMAKWNQGNIDIASQLFKKYKKPILLNQIGDYFDEIAKYSNGYFFSQDTISNNHYNKPILTKLKKFVIGDKERLFVVGLDNNNQELKLALLGTEIRRNLLEIKEATLISPEIGTMILDDYWSRLSTDFVLHGAGALKLFLDQAEKVKQEYAKNEFQRQNSGLFGQFLGFLGFPSNNSGSVLFDPVAIESIISKPNVLVTNIQGINNVNDVRSNANDVTHSPTPLLSSMTPLETPPTLLLTPSPTPLFASGYGGSSVGSPSNNETALPTPSITNTPTPTPIPEESTPTPTPNPNPAVTRQVVINEIAWMGTEKSSNDEWIELYNITSKSIDLTGWTLKSLTLTASNSQPDPIIKFVNKIIDPFGFFLLERTDDLPVSDIIADQIYNGSLDNNGEILQLSDPDGNLQDIVSSSNDGWYAGLNHKIDNIWQRFSMERKNPLEPGNNGENWATNNGIIHNGHNSGDNQINGTPRAQNSVYNGVNNSPTPIPTPIPTPTPTPTLTPLPSLMPSISWQFQVPDASYTGQPAVTTDGTAYFGVPDNATGKFKFYAVSSSGFEKWHFDDNGMPTIPAVFNDNSVYFGHLSGPGIYALKSDGTLKWQYDTSRVNDVSIDDDGNVYDTSDNKTISKINPDGSESWHIQNPFAFGFTPVSVSGDSDVYLTTDSAGLPKFYRLRGSDGHTIWQNRISDSYQYQAFDLVFDEETNKFYTVTTAGHVISVDRDDGTTEQHLFAFGVPATSKVTIFKDILTFGVDFSLKNPASGSAVLGLNKADKSIMWTFPVDSRVNKEIPKDADGNLYFTTHSGKVYSLDKNGQKRWEIHLGINTDFYPVLWNNAVFVSAGGRLFKISY